MGWMCIQGNIYLIWRIIRVSVGIVVALNLIIIRIGFRDNNSFIAFLLKSWVKSFGSEIAEKNNDIACICFDYLPARVNSDIFSDISPKYAINERGGSPPKTYISREMAAGKCTKHNVRNQRATTQ